MAIRTHFCRQWKRFREHLSNRQMENLAGLINAELMNGNLREGASRLIIVTPAPRAAVTVLRQTELLFIVGGHWIRAGEPNAEHLKLIHRDIARIKRGDLP